MLELEEQLRRYGEAVERSFVESAAQPDVSPLRPRLRPTWWRRRAVLAGVAGVAAASVVAIAVAAVTAVRSDRGDNGDVASTSTSTDAVFDARTDTVLLFSDGSDGVTALDLDTGIAARRVIEEAGDQPYRTAITGDHLVVGSVGEIYAVPLDGGTSTLIDSATFFLPAAEPGEVWTVDFGRGREGAEIRRVTMDGTVVISSNTLDTDQYQPHYGVPGGLVVRGPDGLAIWDAATGVVGNPIAPSAARSQVVSDGRHIAWCDGPCEEAHIVDLERTGPPTAPVAPGRQFALSPDGTHLAVLRAASTGPPWAELVVTDLTTGEETRAAMTPLSGSGSLQWAEDSRQLFYASDSFGSGATTLGRYDLATGTSQLVDVDLGDNQAFVPIARDRATALLTGRRVEPSECAGSGEAFPSGRFDVCTFVVRSRNVESE